MIQSGGTEHKDITATGGESEPRAVGRAPSIPAFPLALSLRLRGVFERRVKGLGAVWLYLLGN